MKEQADKGRKRAYKRKDHEGNRLAVIGITAIVLCLGMVVNLKSASVKGKDQEYQIKEELLLQQVEKEKTRADELEKKRVYVQTKQYIEEVAKQKLGLVMPDEILLKPSPR